jgi:hypothetical protein
MERMDQATTDLIEQEVRGRFPEGALDRVAVLQYGDDPAVEPGQVVIEVTVPSAPSAAEPEGKEDPLAGFHQTHRDAIRQLQRDIPQRWPQASRFKLTTGQGQGPRFMMRFPGPEEPTGDLTPVMARLGQADLETLDTLITAGIAANRAQAVRWALARIRERPAYAQLRERAREIEDLKSQF